MKCDKHPRYKGIQKPRCQCTNCWDIWDIKQRSKAFPRPRYEVKPFDTDP